MHDLEDRGTVAEPQRRLADPGDLPDRAEGEPGGGGDPVLHGARGDRRRPSVEDVADQAVPHSCRYVVAYASYEAGMIDEYHLIVFRAVVGGGKRLFADGSPPRGLTVRSTRTTVSGAGAHDEGGPTRWGRPR